MKPMTDGEKKLIALGLFGVLTLLLTYPQILHMATGVRDLGDPLLNTWILSWNIHKLSHLDFRNYFDTNIFFPNKHTLAYSEHLFSQSLFALPFWLISKNPVLAYNIVFLLAFLTSGWGMYLLARYLVKNEFAALVAGIIYAYSPFMFAHLSHIQVATAAGIPLAFLFLHRFFEKGRTRDMLCFAGFYVFQFLANGYYGLYLSFFAGLFIAVLTVAKKKYKDGRFWLNFGLFIALATIAVGPFLSQYLVARHEMGFSRVIGPSASLQSFLTTASINRLYGKITRTFMRPEGELFPGLVALALAVFGFLQMVKIKKMAREESRPAKVISVLNGIVSGLIFLCSIVIVVMMVKGGREIHLGPGFRIKVHNLINPLFILALLFILRWRFTKRHGMRKRRIFLWQGGLLWIYAAIFGLAFIFTFGSLGPYVWLHKYVPGFDGLRVPTRFHIFVMFSLAIFAAFGVRRLFASGPSPLKLLGMGAIVLLILLEYASMPVPVKTIEVKNQIPEVYRWLAAQKEDISLIELPLPFSDIPLALQECPRVYYSIYHWKNMVNGYSGYFPPVYDELCRRWTTMSMSQNFADLKTLGVSHVIFHTENYKKKQIRQILPELERLADKFQTVAIFGDDYVLKLDTKTRGSGVSIENPPVYLSTKSGWRVESNVHPDIARLAIDGSLRTRWESGPQKPGTFFALDLNRVESIRGISLKFGDKLEDYPRGYRAEVSTDGVDWETVSHEEITVLPILNYLKPRDFAMDIKFPPKNVRFIRITNLGEDSFYFWSIFEIEVFQ